MPRKHTLTLVQIALSAALISVCAFITIPLSPPITLQTFGIFLILLLLGWKKGGISLLLYLALGLLGLPVFAGFGGGLGVLLGPSGGYLLGFLWLPFSYALFSPVCRRIRYLAPLPLLLGLFLCYATGAIWYALLFADSNSIGAIFSLTVLPFLVPDFVKLALAIGINQAVRRAGINLNT